MKSLNSEIHSNNSQQEESVDASSEELVMVYSTLWFVGIELKPINEVIDINLTDTILCFKDISKIVCLLRIHEYIFYVFQTFQVFKQAMKTFINTPDLDAKYVKKNKLKEYLDQSILRLEPREPKMNRVKQTGEFSFIVVQSFKIQFYLKKKSSRSESSSSLAANKINSENDQSKSSSANLTAQTTKTSNGSALNTKEYLSPCSDSSDSSSVFAFNGANVTKNGHTPQDKLATNASLNNQSSNESESNSLIENNRKKLKTESSTITNDKQEAINQINNSNLVEDFNINSTINNNGASLNPNKRSLSPNTNHVSIKKYKEMNLKEHSSPQDEELLDTLPLPDSGLRVNQPSLSVVKSSIRVNIGCNKK